MAWALWGGSKVPPKIPIRLVMVAVFVIAVVVEEIGEAIDLGSGLMVGGYKECVEAKGGPGLGKIAEVGLGGALEAQNAAIVADFVKGVGIIGVAGFDFDEDKCVAIAHDEIDFGSPAAPVAKENGGVALMIVVVGGPLLAPSTALVAVEGVVPGAGPGGNSGPFFDKVFDTALVHGLLISQASTAPGPKGMQHE